MDGWNTILSYWGETAYFQVLLLLVSGRVAHLEIKPIESEIPKPEASRLHSPLLHSIFAKNLFPDSKDHR